LQVLEEGELEDNFGHKVSFTNTVIIMTSNVGAEKALGGERLGFFSSPSLSSLPSLPSSSGGQGNTDMLKKEADALKKEAGALKKEALAECRKFFRTEFLARIDETVVFNPLSEDDLRLILRREIAELAESLSIKNCSLTVDEAAFDVILGHARNAKSGAREIRRIVRKELEDPLSMWILENDLNGLNNSDDFPQENDSRPCQMLQAYYDEAEEKVKIYAPLSESLIISTLEQGKWEEESEKL
jgi:ATP-dependent Clp protease ATP-binding subunit ClpC